MRNAARNPRDSFISCHVTFRGRKTRPGYPEVPSSIGEHLRRVRLDRDLWQKDVAREIGCSAASLLNWEKGRAEPELRFLPAILRFLGYDPRALEALGDLGLGESRRLESVCNKIGRLPCIGELPISSSAGNEKELHMSHKPFLGAVRHLRCIEESGGGISSGLLTQPCP
jgi:transcriptional regulator with XRE-family HTH domain